jgi:muramoyltetrapeptide carboxypeptidase
MIVPPPLRPGSKIGIMCPSGYMPVEKTHACVQMLRSWQFQIEMGQTVGQRHHYFSGTDEERLNELQSMFNDPSLDAILFARGGYGLSRIIDRLDFSFLQQRPKWIIGFSDVTLLHSFLTKKGMASIHAPMAGAFNEGMAAEKYLYSLRDILMGKSPVYETAFDEKNRTGSTSAVLTGGNLALLAHNIGSESDIDTYQKILFIEDVGEYIYNVDRMMIQLKRAGKLTHLSGLIVGAFTDMKDTTLPFGMDVYNCIREKVAEFSYPVCFGFPVGHIVENFALVCGLNYQLDVTPAKTSLVLKR